MKQKPRWTLEMLTASLAVLCGLLVLVLLIQRPTAWPALLALVVLWGVVVVLFRCQLRKWVARWMCGGSFEGSKLQFSLEPLSQPAALLSGETVLWYNAQFRTRLLNGQDALVSRVQKVLPGLDLQQCRKQEGQLLTLADGMWSVHSSTVPGDAESMTLLVLNEETALRKVEAEYKASRPGYLVFLVDGYDDVFGDMLDSERARLLEGINRTLEDMIGRGSGFLRRVASGRYIAVVEERQMEQFANRGYDVLDKIRALDPSVNLSLSIGIGRGAKTLREAQDMAVQALDMAQGRGGDQAVVKNGEKIQYYGGKSQQLEKTTRVKARVKAHALRELLETKDRLLIMGHKIGDIDSFGSAIGVYRIAAALGKKAHIVINEVTSSVRPMMDRFINNSDYPQDLFLMGDDAAELADPSTALVVVDVNRPSYTEEPQLLNLVKTIVVIDHHRQSSEIISNATLSYVEPYASSACELVAEILQYVTDSIRIKSLEADAMYAGIVIDTNNFTNQAGVRTFEAAAFLRRNGADVTRVRKLFRDKMEDYKARAEAVRQAEVFEGAFAISVCPAENVESPTVVGAQAANELLDIIGIKASVVLTPYNGKIYVSARSIDEINVQVMMEKLGGGGHRTIAGAQLPGATVEEAKEKIKNVILAMKQKGEF